MSSELAEMLEEPAYWQQHLGSTFFTFFRHHNSSLFPRVYSSGRSQIYIYGQTTNRFSTDEWLAEEALVSPQGNYYSPTTWQIDLVDFTSRGPLWAACDTEGRFYTWGECSEGSVGNIQNALGHGPNDRSLEPTYSWRTRRYSPTRVFGENGELEGVRFVKCGIGSEVDGGFSDFGKWTTSALSDTGVLYMSGTSDLGALGVPGASPRHYHKPLLGYTWKTYCQGNAGIVAIDEHGDAYEWGRSISRTSASSGGVFYNEPTQISNGFLEELAIENPGFGNWDFLGVDPPQQPGGRQAQIQWSIDSNRVITDAWIIEPGSGYTSPPAIRFQAVSNGVAPVISCQLFSSSWKQCEADISTGRFALLSDSDHLYTYGAASVEPFETPIANPVRFVFSPRKHLGRTFKKVKMANRSTFALTTQGELFGMADSSVLPGLEQGKLRKIADGPFVDIASNGSAVLVTDENGVIYGAGTNGGWLGVGDIENRLVLTQAIGNIRAKKLFNGFGGSFVALRDQTYDAAGNPVYSE